MSLEIKTDYVDMTTNILNGGNVNDITEGQLSTIATDLSGYDISIGDLLKPEFWRGEMLNWESVSKMFPILGSWDKFLQGDIVGII